MDMARRAKGGSKADAAENRVAGTGRLPAFVRPLFWDTDAEALEVEKSRFAIIERLLRFGRPRHIRWLMKVYPPGVIAQVVRESVNLDRRTAHYWTIRLGILVEEVRCLKKSSHLEPWDS